MIFTMMTKLLLVSFTIGNNIYGAAAAGEFKPLRECGLYLAPSTIPGAGLGMYAGSKPYGINELVSDSDLMIPTWDLDYHNGGEEYYHLWDEYTWSASMFPGMLDDTEDVVATSTISSGFGAAINCMLPLVNVADEDDWKAGSGGYRLTTSGISSKSPGAGAFTPMTGRRFSAIQPIRPFSELYASYGEGYFNGRLVYDFVPFDRHYTRADELINFFLGNVTSWREMDKSKQKFISTENFEQELWGFIVELRQIWDKSKMMFALPGDNTTTLQDLQQLLDFGGSSLQNYNDTVKSQEWMEEHGQCLDNIRDGISNIPHAGRGAFASRPIEKNGLVSPAPLIHLPNRTTLTIYDHMITPEGKWKRDADSPIHHQLLLNYCFGHKDSLLLLCPYGYLNFLMNHDHKNPNTGVVWNEEKSLRHPEWFNQPLEEWGKTFHSGLSLNYVALRDIEEGEEITIDYGIEWESAWQEHAKNFDPPRPGYIPAFELNEMVDLRIPTQFELDKQFDDILTFCNSYYFPEDFDVSSFKFGTDEDKDEEAEYHYTCRVLIRHDDNNYTVEVTETEKWIGKFDFYEMMYETPVMILFNVPRDAIFFRDRSYGRDHHQWWSFRHDMRLPDEIFPDKWKTSYKNETSSKKTSMTKSSKEQKEDL